MALDVVDGAGQPQQLKTSLDGSTLVTHQNVDNLPTGVTSDIAAIKGHIDGVEAALTAIAGHVDGLETLATALNGFVDGLEGLQTTIAGHLDTVEAKLQTIIDAQAVPSAGPQLGYVGGIGTGSNINFATKALTRGMTIYNLDSTNNLLVRVGGDPGATNVDTLTIKPGLSAFVAVANASTPNLRSSAGTITASYSGA